MAVVQLETHQSGRSLAGRVAAITGAESGIGAACAASLAAAGADVAVLFYNDREAADAMVAIVARAGSRGCACQIDVTQEKSVEAAFEEIDSAFGPPDILINSAGLNQSHVPVADMTLAQWNRILSTDLTGAFLTCRRFLRDLKSAKKKGAIVNISSIHARVARAGAADYDAAKGGVENLTTTLALEAAPHGITVNAIAPGMILTPMNQHAVDDPDFRAGLEASIPLGRAGRPEEIGALATFLASPAGAYITGATITIDGGLSLVLGQGA
ncbi:MAG TPA: SDR family oxidoreductase [Hyphomonadaceae bacterium]|nr:SDR family oxidoreductase [Hyphomonadaceae bacterium]